MFEKLLKLANHLDSHGFHKEADQIDEILREAAFSPEEYKKYYGREMEPERLKEWEDEQQKEPMGQISVQEGLRDGLTNGQLRYLQTFKNTALGLKSFGYDALKEIYADLYRGPHESNWFQVIDDQEHDNLMDRIIEQAEKHTLKYDPRDFPA